MTEAPDPPAPPRFAGLPFHQAVALVAGLAVVLIAVLVTLTQGLGRPTGQASPTGSNAPAGSLAASASASAELAGSNGVPGTSAGATAGPGGSAGPGSTGGPGASEPGGPGGPASPGPGQTASTPGPSPAPSRPGSTSGPGATPPPPTHDPGAVAFVERTRSRAALVDDLAGAIHQQAAAGHWANVRDLAGEMADIAVGEAFWLDTHPPTACYADAHEDAAATWPAIEGLAGAIDQAARGHDRDEIENQLTVVDFAERRLRRYARDAADC